MISKRITCTAAATLCAAVVWTSPSMVHAEPTTVRRARLEVDTTGSGDAAAVLERRLEERGAVVLREGGILPREEDDDPVLRVAVSEVGGDDPGYRYGVTLEGGDGWKHEDTCELCTESELVKAIEGALQQAVTHIPTAGGNTAEPPSPEATPSPRTPPPTPRDRVPIGKLGKAGIGVLVPGVVVLGVGIGLAVANPQVKSSNPLEKTTTRPVGFALVAVGAALTATGAILIAVDRSKARKARLSLGPSVLRRGFAMTARVRF